MLHWLVMRVKWVNVSRASWVYTWGTVSAQLTLAVMGICPLFEKLRQDCQEVVEAVRCLDRQHLQHEDSPVPPKLSEPFHPLCKDLPHVTFLTAFSTHVCVYVAGAN